MFGFRNQPLKTIYLLYSALTLLFVRLPWWTLCAAVPAGRPRQTWSFKQSMMIYFLQFIMRLIFASGFSLPPYDPEEGKKHVDKPGFAWIEPLPKEYLKGEIASMASINKVESVRSYGFWYGTDLKGSKAHPTEKVMYHLHDGAYIMGTSDPTGVLGPIIIDYIKHFDNIFDRVFCLDYRLSSAAPFVAANPFPAPLIDALAGYRYLVETLGFKPSNIIVSGDSAGAHLGFCLARYLAGESIPNLLPPGALVLHSPVADFGCTHVSKPNSSMTRNAPSDVVGPIFLGGYAARAFCGSLPEDSAVTNSWISPGSSQINTRGLFINLPYTFILAGGAEQLLDDMKELGDRLIADNGSEKIKYVEYPNASHVPVFAPYHEPEKTKGALEIARWLSTVYALE